MTVALKEQTKFSQISLFYTWNFSLGERIDMYHLINIYNRMLLVEAAEFRCRCRHLCTTHF